MSWRPTLHPSGTERLVREVLGESRERAEAAALELLRKLGKPLLDVVTDHFVDRDGKGRLTEQAWDALCDADRELHPEHDTERAVA